MLFTSSHDQWCFIKMALVTKWYNYNNYNDLIEALGTQTAPVLSALVDYVMNDLLRNMYD